MVLLRFHTGKHVLELLLGEDGDAQILSLGQLAAGLLARDDIVSFLADGAGGGVRTSDHLHGRV